MESCTMRNPLHTPLTLSALDLLKSPRRLFNRWRAPRVDYSIWIVSPSGFVHSRAFDDLAAVLKEGFEGIGCRAAIARDPREIRGRGIVLGCNLIPEFGLSHRSDNLIMFNMEQIQHGSHWMTPAYLNLLKAHPVWDYSRANIRRLQRLGVEGARLCRVGYEPGLTRIRPRREDIDVLFYGSPNARRDRVLHELERRGLHVVRLFGVYGKPRDRLIARSKIVLNIHFYEARIFEIVRVSYLLANRRFVISEEGDGSDAERDCSGGVVFSPYEKLVETCVAYIEDEASRRRIARTGFHLISRRRQSDFLRALVDCPGRRDVQ